MKAKYVAMLGLVSIIIMLLPGAIASHTEYGLTLTSFEGIASGRIAGSVFIYDVANVTASYDMETLDAGDMADFSVEGNNGVITGPTDIVGRWGRARAFNGVEDEIIAPNDPDLEEIAFVSMFVWANPTLTGDAQQMTVSHYGADAGYEIRTITDGSILVWLGNSPSHNGGLCQSATGVLSANVFQAYGFTFDGTTCIIWHNNTIVETDTTYSGDVGGTGLLLGIGKRDGLADFAFNGSIDEVLVTDDILTDSEITIWSDIQTDYTFRFDTHALVPWDVSNATTYISGANLTWGATGYPTNISFSANASVWWQNMDTGLGAISWDSFSNVTDAEVLFNFTLPSGTYPYWVNNTHQDNLTTVGGETSFNWTDWLDGERLFEIGIEFTSTPLLTGTIGLLYSYQAAVTKTSITGWNLTTGPGWASVSAGGLITGTPDIPGTHAFTLQANATGGVITSQSFSVIVPAIPVPPSLANTGILFIIGFIPFLLMVGIGFWKEQGAMIIVGGIIGVILGLWVIFALQDFGDTWFFGVMFVSIGILFSYVGWVNIDRVGGVG